MVLWYLQSVAFVSDGRHFKPVYGKDFVDSLISNADSVMVELEKSEPDRLAAHHNKSSALQGQIDLLRSHQVSQDRRINFALAREAEESDGRINQRCVEFYLIFGFWLFVKDLFVCLLLHF